MLLNLIQTRLYLLQSSFQQCPVALLFSFLLFALFLLAVSRLLIAFDIGDLIHSDY